MKKYPKIFCYACALLALLILYNSGSAQVLKVPQAGGSPRASVTEQVGLTDVSIRYGRPAVKGREGKVWGGLVSFGYSDLVYGSSKAAPWRAGANENTTMEFSTPVTIEGKQLAAGKYGFHIAAGAEECTLIFSHDTEAWGSYFYDEKHDALRVKVKPVMLNESVEFLRYEFLNQTENSAVIALEWEKWRIPFKLEVDYLNTQIASFRKELTGHDGFDWHAYQEAAQFCVQRKVNLEEALVWADIAAGKPFIGEKNFTTLATKAQVLTALGKTADADAIMKEALPLGKMQEVHAYARQLLQQKKTKEAFEVYKLNYEKHPNEFTTMVGMARAYSATAEYKKAIPLLQKAVPLAPDKANKDNLEAMIRKLQDGKSIN